MCVKARFSHVGKIPDCLGFYCFPDLPRFCWLMKTWNRRYPRSSEINRDASGELGAFLFSRRVPDFCNDQGSFPTNENSNLYRRGCRRLSAMDFAHYQSSKLLKCCYICVQVSIFGALSISSQIHNRKIWDRPLVNIRYIGKIWNGRQKVKSPIVCDFPDIWKPGFGDLPW